MANRSKTEASRGKAVKGRGPRARKKGPEPAVEEQGRHPDLLERGDIFFFYRPDANGAPPEGLLDVNRFHLVLRPEGEEVLRYITIGKKKLPEEGDGQEARHWGFVDGVFRTPEELHRALGGSDDRSTRAAAVPAGEGVYALLRQVRNSVLAYALELPEEPGEVQRAFNIDRRGQLALVVKNPAAGSPAGVGLDADRQVDFPEELQARFGARRWVAADPPAFLDHEGAELLFIAGRTDTDTDGDADLGLEPRAEDEQSADLFRELRLERTDRTIRPLFEGTWE